MTQAQYKNIRNTVVYGFLMLWMLGLTILAYVRHNTIFAIVDSVIQFGFFVVFVHNAFGPVEE